MKHHPKKPTSAASKIKSAKFRLLSEQLYTQTTKESLINFQENPHLFSEYHEGFRQQTQTWKVNPVDIFQSILSAQKPIMTRKTQFTDLTIFDIGCGDAKLQRANPTIKFRSFDLQRSEDTAFIEIADATALPADDESADVCIFSLSLMGEPNKMLQEAHRVLKKDGELWIAEVGSRARLPEFVSGVEKLGFRSYFKEDFNFFHVSCYLKGSATSKGGVNMKPCLYKRR